MKHTQKFQDNMTYDLERAPNNDPLFQWYGWYMVNGMVRYHTLFFPIWYFPMVWLVYGKWYGTVPYIIFPNMVPTFPMVWYHTAPTLKYHNLFLTLFSPSHNTVICAQYNLCITVYWSDF